MAAIRRKGVATPKAKISKSVSCGVANQQWRGSVSVSARQLALRIGDAALFAVGVMASTKSDNVGEVKAVKAESEKQKSINNS